MLISAPRVPPPRSGWSFTPGRICASAGLKSGTEKTTPMTWRSATATIERSPTGVPCSETHHGTNFVAGYRVPSPMPGKRALVTSVQASTAARKPYSRQFISGDSGGAAISIIRA